jgi:hypothetical protein
LIAEGLVVLIPDKAILVYLNERQRQHREASARQAGEEPRGTL